MPLPTVGLLSRTFILQYLLLEVTSRRPLLHSNSQRRLLEQARCKAMVVLPKNLKIVIHYVVTEKPLPDSS